MTPRVLDHVVLPVPSLKIARERYAQLGFTVSPDGRHKFGSENCCIHFENGTFIEPLAIGHRETVEAAIDKGNNFLRRDMGYRFRNGDDGFTCLVFGEPDPKSARKDIQKAGWETGKLVTVRRPGVKAKIALGIDERSPDFTCFLCERPDGSKKVPNKKAVHENGATGIKAVTLCEQLPEDFQYYLQTMSGQREVRSHSFGMEIQMPNGSVNVLNRAGLRAHYGKEAPIERGVRAMAFDVTVKDLKAVAGLLDSSSVETRQVGPRLIVDPARGQGAMIAFVEA